MGHKSENSTEDRSIELLEPIREYMQLAIELMLEESQAALAELLRMENILGDAAAQLRDSFTGMDELISRELNGLPGEGDPVILDERTQSLKLRLAGQYRDSIMALQFEDIVMQMIGHSKSRGHGIDKILTDVRQNLAALSSGEWDREDLLRAIAASRRDIEKFRSERGANNPVNQGSLQSGDIELF